MLKQLRFGLTTLQNLCIFYEFIDLESEVLDLLHITYFDTVLDYFCAFTIQTVWRIQKWK